MNTTCPAVQVISCTSRILHCPSWSFDFNGGVEKPTVRCDNGLFDGLPENSMEGLNDERRTTKDFEADMSHDGEIPSS